MMVLQVANHWVRYLVGVVEYMLIKISKFYFATNFPLLEMEEDICKPISLGRAFLTTRGTIIDVLAGKLALSIGKDKQEFNIFKILKCSSTNESY